MNSDVCHTKQNQTNFEQIDHSLKPLSMIIFLDNRDFVSSGPRTYLFGFNFIGLHLAVSQTSSRFTESLSGLRRDTGACIY